MAPVKREKRAKAALSPKIPRSTTAIRKPLSFRKIIDKIVKSRTDKAEPNSELAPCKEFAQMTQRLRELGRKLGFS